LLPQSADGTVSGNQHIAVADLLLLSGAAAEVKVRIQRLVLVVLDTVELVAQTEIEHEVGPKVERVINVGGPFRVTVATRKVRLAHRQRNAFAGEFALRVDGRLELIDVAGHKVTQG